MSLMSFAAIGRRTECDDGRVVADPRAWMWFFRASSKLNVAAPNPRLGWVKNPRTCRPWSTLRMVAASHRSRSLNPYAPAPDEPGIGMLSTIDIGEETEGA